MKTAQTKIASKNFSNETILKKIIPAQMKNTSKKIAQMQIA